MTKYRTPKNAFRNNRYKSQHKQQSGLNSNKNNYKSPKPNKSPKKVGIPQKQNNLPLVGPSVSPGIRNNTKARESLSSNINFINKLTKLNQIKGYKEYKMNSNKKQQSRKKLKPSPKQQQQVIVLDTSEEGSDDDVIEIKQPPPPLVAIDDSSDEESQNQANEEPNSGACSPSSNASGDDFIINSDRCRLEINVQSIDNIDEEFLIEESVLDSNTVGQDTIDMGNNNTINDSSLFVTPNNKTQKKQLKSQIDVSEDYQVTQSNFRAFDVYESESSDMPESVYAKGRAEGGPSRISSSDVEEVDENETEKQSKTKRLRKRKLSSNKGSEAYDTETDDDDDGENVDHLNGEDTEGNATPFPYLSRGEAVEHCKNKIRRRKSSKPPHIRNATDEKFMNIIRNIAKGRSADENESDISNKSDNEEEATVTARSIAEDVINKLQKTSNKNQNNNDGQIEEAINEKESCGEEEEAADDALLTFTENINRTFDLIDGVNNKEENEINQEIENIPNPEEDISYCQNKTMECDSSNVETSERQENFYIVDEITDENDSNDANPETPDSTTGNDCSFVSIDSYRIQYEFLETVNSNNNEHIGWNDEMIRFYDRSWGGEKFSVFEIKKSMNTLRSKWKINNDDMYPKSKRYFSTKLKCHNCCEFGHKAMHCPKRKRELVCFMCGEQGHREPRCPHTICLRCGTKQGVFMKQCKNCFKQNKLVCPICNIQGHSLDYCPDKWRRYCKTTLPNQAPDKNIVYNKKKFCCICARQGHLAENCRDPSCKYTQSYPIITSQIKSFEKSYEDVILHNSIAPNVISYNLFHEPNENVHFNFIKNSEILTKQNFYYRFLNSVGLMHRLHQLNDVKRMISNKKEINADKRKLVENSSQENHEKEPQDKKRKTIDKQQQEQLNKLCEENSFVDDNTGNMYTFEKNFIKQNQAYGSNKSKTSCSSVSPLVKKMFKKSIEMKMKKINDGDNVTSTSLEEIIPSEKENERIIDDVEMSEEMITDEIQESQKSQCIDEDQQKPEENTDENHQEIEERNKSEDHQNIEEENKNEDHQKIEKQNKNEGHQKPEEKTPSIIDSTKHSTHSKGESISIQIKKEPSSPTPAQKTIQNQDNEIDNEDEDNSENDDSISIESSDEDDDIEDENLDLSLTINTVIDSDESIKELPDFIPIGNTIDYENLNTDEDNDIETCGISHKLSGKSYDGDSVTYLPDKEMPGVTKVNLANFNSKFLQTVEGIKFLDGLSKKYDINYSLYNTENGNYIIISGLPKKREQFYIGLLFKFRDISQILNTNNAPNLLQSKRLFQKIPKYRIRCIKFIQKEILELQNNFGNVIKIYDDSNSTINVRSLTKKSRKILYDNRRKLNMILVGQLGYGDGRSNLFSLMKSLKILQESHYNEIPNEIHLDICKNWKEIFSSELHDHTYEWIQNYKKMQKINKCQDKFNLFQVLGKDGHYLRFVKRQQQKPQQVGNISNKDVANATTTNNTLTFGCSNVTGDINDSRRNFNIFSSGKKKRNLVFNPFCALTGIIPGITEVVCSDKGNNSSINRRSVDNKSPMSWQLFSSSPTITCSSPEVKINSNVSKTESFSEYLDKKQNLFTAKNNLTISKPLPSLMDLPIPSPTPSSSSSFVSNKLREMKNVWQRHCENKLQKILHADKFTKSNKSVFWSRECIKYVNLCTSLSIDLNPRLQQKLQQLGEKARITEFTEDQCYMMSQFYEFLKTTPI